MLCCLNAVKIMNSRLSALILLLLIPGSITMDRLSVTCKQKSICAVKGSEVTLKCFYSNFNIKTVFWFNLQVRMNPASTDKRDHRQLTCHSSCTSTSGSHYYWMKNGQYFGQTESPNIFVLISRDAGSFSCSRDQNLKHPSSSVCVSQSVCWDVTYTSTRVCALVNSTVDISCTYSHPSDHTVNKTFWHYSPSGVFKDLREEHQFAGRVEYVGNKLRIKELKINDSGEYRFMIKIN
ncbi:sialoadhesin-like isoform X1 [Labeo rohita]|uniref:Sialoadhesin-like isoform X1 n=1 Tax=Labeo rohita TaxID=84645 RepID=A0A498P540_LABRO|nr:sialoadhesin-like isoform X1 [Labeo rohita]